MARREPSPGDLVPADVRARLKSLRLATRRHATAALLGQHGSRQRGAGLEFAQYRAYEQGDEPRRIDWKLYARSDRWFVRESERDSALDVWLVLDASASMRQADVARLQWRKFDAARALAACVVELALRQGDRFGLLLASDAGCRWLPPALGPRQRDQVTLALARAQPEGAWPDDETLRPIWTSVARGALVIALGDAFDEGYLALLEKLSATRREVVSIQVLAADERDFPFRGGHRFVEQETGAELRLDGEAARAEFLEQFAAARAAVAARLAAAGVRHVEYFLDEPLDMPLRRLFAARAADTVPA